ncbi:hypothetical protein MMC28_000508 [Mycoblastus sanguinarius]|nr:hypothetical protein [Mycoblastus sanguinarius]
MDPTPYQPPELASVLRALAASSHAQPPVSQTQQTTAYGPTADAESDDLEEGEYDPSTFVPLTSATPHPQPASSTPLHPTIIQPPQPKKYIPPQPPPETITTYPPALRHVTAKVASDPNFTPRIRKLIQSQHQHERQWWEARQDLLRKLDGRDESRKKLDSVLASVGGNITPSSSSTLSPEQEMAIYDTKVHRVCTEMVKAAEKELERLEVPFFCTMKGLIGEKGKKRKGAIGEEELVDLKGRMLGFLEDLCGGDEGH